MLQFAQTTSTDSTAKESASKYQNVRRATTVTMSTTPASTRPSATGTPSTDSSTRNTASLTALLQPTQLRSTSMTVIVWKSVLRASSIIIQTGSVYQSVPISTMERTCRESARISSSATTWGSLYTRSFVLLIAHRRLIHRSRIITRGRVLIRVQVSFMGMKGRGSA